MTPRPLPVRRPWSLTARLITLQVLAMTGLLGGVLGLLYYNISGHLDSDNREEFRNETGLISNWLADVKQDHDDAATFESEHGGHLAAMPILIRLLRADGSVQLENHRSWNIPGEVFPAPDQLPENWRAPDKRRYLLGAVRLQLPKVHPGPVLLLAYDVSDDDTLLRHLRQRMGLVFGLTVAIASLLAFLIARGVLRPLTQLTATAARIHASQLAARIDESGWPAELTTLAREFNAMLARLDDSFGRLARFSSDLSHELRTPINNLRGEAEVALSRPRSAEDYRRVLESGLEECVRLGRLIDTLLFIAQADHPAHGIRRRPLDAAAECRVVADFFEATAAERNLTILVRGAAPVHCDAELLRRALANLLDNAVRHTAPGGHIDLTVRENAGRGTEIEVRDNGTGIAPEHLPHVFERFYRSEKHPGEVRAASGFGLGLAIVKSIMELHGGSVEISSSPGSGTTVTLFFLALP